MKYRDVERILLDHGFEQKKPRRGSHRQYQGVVDGQRKLVTLAPHSWNDDIHRDVLNSICRQSGLPKGLFR